MTDFEFINKGQEAKDKVDEHMRLSAKNIKAELIFMRDYFYLNGTKQSLMTTIDMIEIIEAVK